MSSAETGAVPSDYLAQMEARRLELESFRAIAEAGVTVEPLLSQEQIGSLRTFKAKVDDVLTNIIAVKAIAEGRVIRTLKDEVRAEVEAGMAQQVTVQSIRDAINDRLDEHEVTANDVLRDQREILTGALATATESFGISEVISNVMLSAFDTPTSVMTALLARVTDELLTEFCDLANKDYEELQTCLGRTVGDMLYQIKLYEEFVEESIEKYNTLQAGVDSDATRKDLEEEVSDSLETMTRAIGKLQEAADKLSGTNGSFEEKHDARVTDWNARLEYASVEVFRLDPYDPTELFYSQLGHVAAREVVLEYERAMVDVLAAKRAALVAEMQAAMTQSVQAVDELRELEAAASSALTPNTQAGVEQEFDATKSVMLDQDVRSEELSAEISELTEEIATIRDRMNASESIVEEHQRLVGNSTARHKHQQCVAREGVRLVLPPAGSCESYDTSLRLAEVLQRVEYEARYGGQRDDLTWLNCS